MRKGNKHLWRPGLVERKGYRGGGRRLKSKGQSELTKWKVRMREKVREEWKPGENWIGVEKWVMKQRLKSGTGWNVSRGGLWGGKTNRGEKRGAG